MVYFKSELDEKDYNNKHLELIKALNDNNHRKIRLLLGSMDLGEKRWNCVPTNFAFYGSLFGLKLLNKKGALADDPKLLLHASSFYNKNGQYVDCIKLLVKNGIARENPEIIELAKKNIKEQIANEIHSDQKKIKDLVEALFIITNYSKACCQTEK